jgi:hypothetical protein
MKRKSKDTISSPALYHNGTGRPTEDTKGSPALFLSEQHEVCLTLPLQPAISLRQEFLDAIKRYIWKEGALWAIGYYIGFLRAC